MRISQRLYRIERSLPFAVKLLLLLAALVLVSMGVVVFLALRAEREAIQKLYVERALTMKSVVEADVTTEGYLIDQAHAQEHVEAMVRLAPTLRRVNLYTLQSGQPRVWASSDPRLVGQPGDAGDVAPIHTGRATTVEVTRDGEQLLEVLAPVVANGRPVATVGIYMSVAPREEALRAMATQIILATVVAASVALGGLYLSTYHLAIKRMRRLSAAVGSMARGEYGTRTHETAAPGTRDELTLLAAGLDQMTSAIQRLHAETEQLATTDGLTGLYNHRYFDDALPREIKRAERIGYPVTLLFLDIDHFKDVNDTYGHAAGDAVLRTLGPVLRRNVRDVDVVARYGGEEFVIILSGCPFEAAGVVAEKLRRSVEQMSFVIPLGVGQGDGRVSITVSIGAAVYPDTAKEASALVVQADAAMYRAKQGGRNHIVMADVAPDASQAT